MTCDCDLTFYVGNSNVIEWVDLTNSATGAFDTGATVTVTLQDRDGANVTGETWPVAMPYVAATDATYRATLSNDLELVAGRVYTAVLTATGTSGAIGYRTASVLAANRHCA